MPDTASRPRFNAAVRNFCPEPPLKSETFYRAIEVGRHAAAMDNRKLDALMFYKPLS